MDWLGNRINEIHKLNELISSGFISLDAEIMDHKPQPNVWSINECFDHIIQSNNKYYSIIDSGSLSTYKKKYMELFPIINSFIR